MVPRNNSLHTTRGYSVEILSLKLVWMLKKMCFFMRLVLFSLALPLVQIPVYLLRGTIVNRTYGMLKNLFI